MDDEPVTASDFYHKGIEYLKRGEFDLALSYINDAISRNYYGADIALAKGEVLFELAKFEDSLDWFDRAIAQDAGVRSEALLWKGRTFFELKQYGRALSAFNRVISDSPMPGEAYLSKAMVLCERGDYLKCLESLEEARSLLGEDSDKLADILFWEGRALAGMKAYGDAIARLERAVALSPDFIDAYAELGELFRLQGRLEEACDVYRRGIREFPDDSALRNDYGNVLRDLGRFEDSLDELNTAIELDGDGSVAIFNRAITYERMGDWRSALTDYRKVLERHANDVEARLRRLDILSRHDLFEDAEEEWQRIDLADRADQEAVEVYARLLNRLARSLEATGEGERVLGVYRQILDLHPDYLDLDNPSKQFASADERHEVILQLLRGISAEDPNASVLPLLSAMLLFRQEQSAEAHEMLERALQGTYRAPALVTRAEAAFHSGELEAALADVNEALTLIPGFVKALWLKVAILEEGMSRPAEAIAVYQEILQHSPDNPSVLYDLGVLYLVNGDPLRALGCFRHLLQATPGEISVQGEIAQCYLAIGRTGEAIDELRRICRRNEEDLRLKLHLADALIRGRERTEAAEILDAIEAHNGGVDPAIEDACLELRSVLLNQSRRHAQALEALSGIPFEELSDIGMLQRGIAMVQTGDLQGALAAFQRVVTDRDARSLAGARAYLELAKIQRSEGNLEAAIDVMRELVGVHPFEWKYRTLLVHFLREHELADEAETEESRVAEFRELAHGRRLLLAEEYEDAAEDLAFVVKNHPQSAEGHYLLAAAECRRGQFGLAAFALKQAITLRPEFLEAAKGDPFFDGLAFSELNE